MCHPRRRSLRLCLTLLACLLAAVPAAAQITIECQETPLDLTGQVAANQVARAGAASPVLAVRGDDVASRWIIPRYEVDFSSSLGTTTLFSIRHEGEEGEVVEAAIDVFDSTFFPRAEETVQLLPEQIATRSMRDVLAPGMGTATGFVVVTATGAPVSVDVFQLDPEGNFATGDVAVGTGSGQCDYWKLRYFNGGTFDGGTQLKIFTDFPRGDAEGAPPTVSMNLWAEDGTFVQACEVFTPLYSFELDAADLATADEPFGAIELVVSRTSEAFVSSVQTASDKFSVGLNAICKDDVLSMPVATPTP